MARRRRKRRKNRPTSGTLGGRKVHVKSHTRGPRGPDKGKPRVKVPAYSRRKPRNRR